MNCLKGTVCTSTLSLVCSIVGITIFMFGCLCVLMRMHALAGITIAVSMLASVSAIGLGFLSILIITLKRSKRSGYGRSVLSIFLAGPLFLLTASSLYVSYVRAERARAYTGEFNLKLLGQEVIDYARSKEGILPNSNGWCDLLMKHNASLTKDNFTHPRAKQLGFKGECQFAFNRNIFGMNISDIASNTVVLYEADGPWNLCGTEELLATRLYRKSDHVSMFLKDGTIVDYWVYQKGIRRIGSNGMYYEKPRWIP